MRRRMIGMRWETLTVTVQVMAKVVRSTTASRSRSAFQNFELIVV